MVFVGYIFSGDFAHVARRIAMIEISIHPFMPCNSAIINLIGKVKIWASVKGVHLLSFC